MNEILKDYQNGSSYHLYKSGQEQSITPTSIEDYVFKYYRVMPFRDIIIQVAKENRYLLPKNKSFEAIERAWNLYRALRKEAK